MANLFKVFKGKLSEVQQKLLDNLINRKLPIGINTRGSRNSMPVTVFREVDEDSKMVDAAYNDLITSLLIDIESLYINSDVLSDYIGNNESISKSWVKSINNELDKLEAKIEEYRRLYGDTNGYNAVYYELFNEINNAILGGCEISSGELTIKPDTSLEYTKPLDIKRVSLTTYPAENHVAGIYLSAPSEFNIENDYNSKNGTKKMIKKGTSQPGAWVSIMLTDSDIRSYIDDVNYIGYTCVIRIFYSDVKTINTLTIDPATRHELNISRLRYRSGGVYQTDDDGWEVITKTRNTNDIYNGDTLKVTGKGSASIKMVFDTIFASAIEITFNMPSYDVIRYKFDPSVIRNALMWDDITNKEYEYLMDKYTNKDNIKSSDPLNSSTAYLNKTIVDINNLKSFDSMLKGVRSSLNIDKSKDLYFTGIDSLYVLSNPILETALKDELVDINKNEYIIGAYSITAEYNAYGNTGYYESHVDYGFDTYEGTLIRASIESDFELPALSSIEFFIVSDTGLEIPIMPLGRNVHREPMDAAVDELGNANFTTSFTPTSNVYVYKWENGEKIEVGNFPANPDNRITASSLNKMTAYAVEYEVESSSNTVILDDSITRVSWSDTNVEQNNNVIQLPTSPYIDYNYYDWDNNVWLPYIGLAGYYNDPTVLPQGFDSPMWSLPVSGFVSGEYLNENTDRYGMGISGFFTTSGDYYFVLNGKNTQGFQYGEEDFEYSYIWHIPVSGYATGDFPLPSTIILNDSNLDFLTPYEFYNNNLYEPIELFVNGIKATDVTNYKKDNTTSLNSFMSQNYEYFVNNDKLFTNFPSGYNRISSRFRYLTKYIRVKIILSTNEICNSMFTPVVRDYTLRLLGA
jgi:hypothetical protein